MEKPPPYSVNNSATTMESPEFGTSSRNQQNTGLSCPHCGPGADNDHTLQQLRAGICPRKITMQIPPTFVYSGNAGGTNRVRSANVGSCAGLVLFKRGWSRIMVLSIGALIVLGAIGYGIYTIATSPTHEFQVAAQFSDYVIFGQFAKISFISQFAYFSFASQISICSVFSMISVCSFASMLAVFSGTSMLSIIAVKRALLAFTLWKKEDAAQSGNIPIIVRHGNGRFSTNNHYQGHVFSTDYDNFDQNHHNHHDGHTHNHGGHHDYSHGGHGDDHGGNYDSGNNDCGGDSNDCSGGNDD